MSSLPSPIRSPLSAAIRGVYHKAGGVYGRVGAEPDSWVFDQRGMNFNGEAMTDARNCAF